MADFNIASELRAKLMKAQSAQEVMDILTASGTELAEEDVERIWQELTHHKVDYQQEVSLEEIAAVSGGGRNLKKEGCAATVESGSWCWSNDKCVMCEVVYDPDTVDWDLLKRRYAPI